ncbi:YdcF family protein [Luteolibacter ambystomatis]|uniref:YdcF family protein n=1 Tax=Luteolibacter ambystomatis TaxID=2824561 RepID=A0A975J056_9BACT|nr:YdcF family protein [Luteolibacter ambystomatis]QUE51585.1 YdcF family protein [Luteolibacter ambystomatis]
MSTFLLPVHVDRAARILWDYHRLDESIHAAAGIVVFGSNDLRVAAHAADLYHRGMGRWIVFSGARGRMTEHWPETEAMVMAETARAKGVPASDIHIENRATHTGENIRFSREIVDRISSISNPLVVVQKPYMERRTRAALDIQWPDRDFLVTSPPIRFDAYFTEELTPSIVLGAMTGDFQRILDYPAKGFASTQPVSPEVMEAFQILCSAGYGDPLP